MDERARAEDARERAQANAIAIAPSHAQAKATSSVDAAHKFGARLLRDNTEVFTQNAWDHVEWDAEQAERARDIVAKQREAPVADADKALFLAAPASFWDSFYTRNENKFFRDRHWLSTEFPELFDTIKAVTDTTVRFWEVGCGVGNTVFPLLAELKQYERQGGHHVYASDYSSTAIDLVKTSPNYDETTSTAFVFDLTSEELPAHIKPGTLDVCICIFVMSAIRPELWARAARNMHRALKPGGYVLFRDYGRYDMAQLRLKKNRLLEDNFYVRGDGTCVYFFTQEQVRARLFPADMFSEEQNAVDSRLLVNRSRQLKMYRVWIQAKYRKVCAVL